MPVWGRYVLVDCDGGRVFRLEKPVVSLGRQEAKQADILVEAEQDKRGSFFCSSIQFELRHADGRATVVDRSANGTFLNIDEAGFADANAAAPSGVFKTLKQEQTWMKAQFPNPRLVKGADTDIADGDALFIRLSNRLNELKKYVFYLGTGDDSDTSDGEDSRRVAVPGSGMERLEQDQILLPRPCEKEGEEEDWAPLPDLHAATGTCALSRSSPVRDASSCANHSQPASAQTNLPSSRALATGESSKLVGKKLSAKTSTLANGTAKETSQSADKPLAVKCSQAQGALLRTQDLGAEGAVGCSPRKRAREKEPQSANAKLSRSSDRTRTNFAAFMDAGASADDHRVSSSAVAAEGQDDKEHKGAEHGDGRGRAHSKGDWAACKAAQLGFGPKNPHQSPQPKAEEDCAKDPSISGEDGRDWARQRDPGSGHSCTDQRKDELEKEVRALERKIAISDSELGKAQRAAANAALAAEKKLQRMTETVEDLRNQIKRLETEAEKSAEGLEKSRASERGLKTQVEELKQQQKSLAQELGSARTNASMQVRELEKQVAALKTEQQMHLLQRTDLDRERQDLLARLAGAEDSAKEADRKLEEQGTRVQELDAKVLAKDVDISSLERSLRDEKARADSALEALEKAKREHTRDKEQVEEAHRRQLLDVRNACDAARAEIAAGQKKIADLEDKIRAETRRADSVQHKLCAAEESKAKAETHNAKLQEQTSALSNELAEQRKQLKALGDAEDRLRSELATQKGVADTARRETEDLRRRGRIFCEDFPDRLRKMSEMMTGLYSDYNDMVQSDKAIGSGRGVIVEGGPAGPGQHVCGATVASKLQDGVIQDTRATPGRSTVGKSVHIKEERI